MKVAVKDTNVFIDLEFAGLFEVWPRLGIEVHTTDFIVAELDRGRRHAALEFCRSKMVTIHEFESDELFLVYQLRRLVSAGVSVNDCSAH